MRSLGHRSITNSSGWDLHTKLPNGNKHSIPLKARHSCSDSCPFLPCFHLKGRQHGTKRMLEKPRFRYTSRVDQELPRPHKYPFFQPPYQWPSSRWTSCKSKYEHDSLDPIQTDQCCLENFMITSIWSLEVSISISIPFIGETWWHHWYHSDPLLWLAPHSRHGSSICMASAQNIGCMAFPRQPIFHPPRSQLCFLFR